MSTEAPTARIAIVGGSGLYALAGLESVREVRVDTPFGPPSDLIRIGKLAGRDVAFLARHGADHRLQPGVGCSHGELQRAEQIAPIGQRHSRHVQPGGELDQPFDRDRTIGQRIG